jgi:hypothetical protein
MSNARITFHRPARDFGRRQPFVLALPAEPCSALSDDARLFAMTFLGGLLFMTVYLA